MCNCEHRPRKRLIYVFIRETRSDARGRRAAPQRDAFSYRDVMRIGTIEDLFSFSSYDTSQEVTSFLRYATDRRHKAKSRVTSLFFSLYSIVGIFLRSHVYEVVGFFF